ncbi:FAD-dependent oxidoreductase [Xinfangfangia sp. D13-10-4-6]|uniref:NAD(P)/FAD-dependent oxidoreductase n=1 Tax=Pseudogemmobacter hezensis TaxID=2737662 RepID=UPI001553D7DD|nr:FAD-binding oxidoreductase [Pseudogemmobacter hezensis]NPD16793.1 FAD-dependent oxidoreductase [Pseudogemmobacter hezensis]
MTPLPRSASTVIIGGGVQGLSAAFNLAEMGQTGIVVIDAGYWQGGASGRNGTLIRPGFASTAWTELFMLTVAEWKTWSKRLGENVMFTQRGYSVVSEKAASAAMLEEATAMQRDLGIRSRMLKSAEISDLLPAINRKRVLAVQHQEEGGVAPHHAALKGLRAYCEHRGVALHYRTKITGIEVTDGRASAVWIGDHRIDAGNILSCAGPDNPDMARLAGVEIDGFGMKIEAMALEPTRPLIKPAIALIDSLAYFHQTSRGEVVGGTEVPERPRMSLRVDVPVMAEMARIYLEMFPQLGPVRILRHWAGQLHASTDYAPLLGEHPARPGLWFSAGWSYGFAGAPAAGRLLAGAIGKGHIDSRMKPFALDRFQTTGPIIEKGIVLA